jgi:DNA-binding GntR family transcriptional regulator
MASTADTGAGNDDDFPRSRTELVAGELRTAILRGQLKSGERIGQARIAELYGTSRIPVREALQLLQAEGLVTLLPNSGARVARLELEELVRERLEPFALSLSVPRLEDQALSELADIRVQLDEAADGGDLSRWLELDRRFHLSSMSAAPARLRRIIDSLWNGTAQYRRSYLVLPDRLQITHLEHRLLLEAIRSRRADDAAALLLVHIRHTRETLAGHPELFEAGADDAD